MRLQQARPDQYPDYHFLLISPNLGAEWLFDAARAYWDRFRPTVINDFNFILLIPVETTIAVTVVARRDTAADLGVQLAQRRPNALYDPVVFDLFDETKAALEERARLSQPFGVPLTAQLPEGISPFIPTPRPTASPVPEGHVTETPAPPPTGNPASTGAPVPVSPTPGAITGG